MILAHYDSPVGTLTLASDQANLIGLWIEGQKYFQATVPRPETREGLKPELREGLKPETREGLKPEQRKGSRPETREGPQPELQSGTVPVLAETRAWLDDYFAGRAPDPSRLRLAPRGSQFRQLVWHELLAIPYGSTTTYGQIAKQITAQTGKPMSAQPVGGAVGHNPISIIIPCHRVVGADGSLTGYAGGIATKLALLQLEGADLGGLYAPTQSTAP